MPGAIEITLYDANDEPKETYRREVIPWGLLKKAARLAGSMDESPERPRKWYQFWMSGENGKTTEERQMEAISRFVVELFGSRFTVKELEEGADFGEIMSIFRNVMTRANQAITANPITPRQTPPKS